MKTTSANRFSTFSSSLLHSVEALAATSGISPRTLSTSLRRHLRISPDPQRALNNFHRFLSSGFTSSLLSDFLSHDVLLRITIELFGQSQYLADIIVRDPELFRWLTTPEVLHAPRRAAEYASGAQGAVRPFTKTENKVDALKRFQRRELLRIGAREILGLADLASTTAELSALADAILETLLLMTEHRLAERTGIAVQSTFAVLALGKLGGEELNFSSDIDLMFVYEGGQDIERPEARIRSAQEYYTRLAEAFVAALTAQTHEGHFYRVDLRLRPDGSAGPIVLPRTGYLAYYETRGEPWERQMLIKARVAAGDRHTGARLLKELKPFLYPRTHLESPLHEIALMKKRIEERLTQEENVKLGAGGIRDIEFIVQALQLLYGGDSIELRARNTLDAVERLAAAGKLTMREARDLRSAYEMLRIVEHRLQLLHGMQTHSLPHHIQERHVLARRLGFRNVSGFMKKLNEHRARVKRIVRSIFALQPYSSFGGNVSQRRRSDTKDALKGNRDALRDLRPLFDASETEQKLLRRLRSYRVPSWGLANLVRIAETPALRRSLQTALTNEKMVDLLVLIASRSQRLSMLLSQEPLLFESLLGRPETVLGEELGWSFLRGDDPIRYKRYNEFRILVRWLLGLHSAESMNCELTNLAESLVMERFDPIVHALRRNGKGIEAALVVLGKMGGEEITVDADLDLFMVYRSTEGRGTQERVEEAARDFLNSFTLGAQMLYTIDMRLRPEGKSAPLAVEFDYYRKYLETRASMWERQSLTKARVLGPPGSLKFELEQLLMGQCYEKALPPGWVEMIAEMRRSMERERSKGVVDLKVGRGGMVDVEFLVQMLQLKYGGEIHSLRVRSTLQVLDLLREHGLLNAREWKTLRASWRFFRSLETMIRLNAAAREFVLPRSRPLLEVLAAGACMRSVGQLRNQLTVYQRANRFLLKAITKRCKQP